MYENEKVDMRIKYTREWTFEALHRILQTKEYNEIKISEIIDKAGISRATFYRNFNTKDDVVVIKVKTMFQDFLCDMMEYYEQNQPTDETILINEFFKMINKDEKVVDTVIRTNLEYLMVDGIISIIHVFRDTFYEYVKANQVTEEYTMDIVAASAWRLLSRWYKNGKKESPQHLSRIFLSAFRSVYRALFEDRFQD